MTNEVVLKNLKRIWNQRKRELGLTQVSAAKDLGWTQGALSQYLNNLTELRPSATIKLANYLSVPASDIDPNIHMHMPNHLSVRVKHRNLSTKILKQATTESMSVVGNKNTFVIEINEDTIMGRNNRLLYQNTRLICTDTKVLQQAKQSAKPVTTYSVLTQKTSTQKKLELDGVLYSHWRNIDTSAYLNHYTIMSIILV
jgi:transcriptional regulator with XRE-family HTH domain